MTKRVIYSIIVAIIICIGVNLCYYKTYGYFWYGYDGEVSNDGGIGGSTWNQLGSEVIDSINKKEETDAGADTIDSTISGAQDFLNSGNGSAVQQDKLRETSNFIFNLLLAFAMIVAVIIGMIIGMKFMVASIEEKAKVKEALVPYVAGCVVVFGAFGIWKLAVTILSSW